MTGSESLADLGGAALGGLRVVEIGDETVLYCGKLLADMGADVIRVERPGGDAVRRAHPLLQGHPDPGVLHLYWNTSKRSLELNLDASRDRERLRTLMLESDLVIESLPPGWLESHGRIPVPLCESSRSGLHLDHGLRSDRSLA